MFLLPWERRHPAGPKDFGRLKYAEEEELVLSQLPCWADLTPEQYRARIAELVEEIEAEARADREARGIEPLGAEAILRQDPDGSGQTKGRRPDARVPLGSFPSALPFVSAYPSLPP